MLWPLNTRLNLNSPLSKSLHVCLEVFPISVLFLSSWKPPRFLSFFFFVFHSNLWIPHHHFPIHYILASHWVNKFFWHLLPLPSLAIPPPRMVPINIACQGTAGLTAFKLAGSGPPFCSNSWVRAPPPPPPPPQAPAANSRPRDSCFQSPTLPQEDHLKWISL